MTPAVTCALAVPSESKEGMDGMRPAVPVVVDVEAAVSGPGPSRETRDEFLDLKTFPKMRFISLMIDVKEKEHSIT